MRRKAKIFSLKKKKDLSQNHKFRDHRGAKEEHDSFDDKEHLK